MDDNTKSIRVYIAAEEPEVNGDDAENYGQKFVTVDVPGGSAQRIKVTSPDMAAVAYQIGDDTATTNVGWTAVSHPHLLTLTDYIDQTVLCRRESDSTRIVS